MEFDSALAIVPSTDVRLSNIGRSESALATVATHTRTIGIIYPPLDIRTIVDKTSQFVAKCGPVSEKLIADRNPRNANFNFLKSSDPYHAYYQHRLSEARAQNHNTFSEQSSDSTNSAAPFESKVSDGKEALFRPVRRAVEPPEPEQYTVQLPKGITGQELDIIKLTAQFVARNGESLMTGLMTNPQFHFVKPTHSKHTFFKSFVSAYSKVLTSHPKLENSVSDVSGVLERCLHRLEWEQSQEEARQKAEDEEEQERIQMAAIDWHAFVVVESIDFADDEDEDLPPPMSLEEMLQRRKMTSCAAVEEETVEPGKEVEMEMDEEELNLVKEGLKVDNIMDEPMRIVRNWKMPELAADRDPTKFVSQFTGELIPINEMSEHIRISLIDPKYREQKERMLAKNRDTTLAPDDEITMNIAGLSRTRPDIFGTTAEEVSNAVKPETEKKIDDQPKQVIHPSLNIPRPSNTVQFCMPNSTRIPIVNTQFPPMPLVMPPEEPEPKRRKLDDSVLILENQFLAQYPGPACIYVTDLKGKVLRVTMESLSETISCLKEKISGEMQLPANKQKLSGKAGVLKDNLSLAYYNVAPGESLEMSRRERGGRKR